MDSSRDASRLLAVPAGPFQIPAIAEARRMGLWVCAMDGNPNAPGLALADCSEAANPADAGHILTVARRYEVNGIFAMASDPCVVPTADAASELRLPGPTREAARLSRNKLLARRRLQAQCPEYAPAFRPVTSLDELKAAAGELGYPFVLKPVESNGSKGVVIIAEASKLGDFFDYVSRFTAGNALYTDEPMIAETYMDGPEFSIEGLATDQGLQIAAITEKTTTPPPYCVEIGHVVPARLEPENRMAIEKAAERIAEVFHLSQCGFHAEMRLTSAGVKLVEVGARLGGGCIASHLVPLATGVNIVRAAIMQAIGETPDLAATRDQGAAIRFLTADAGTVERITGLEEARTMEGVHEVSCEVNPGDAVRRFENSDQRIGHVIATGRDAGEAQERAQAAANLVRIICAAA